MSAGNGVLDENKERERDIESEERLTGRGGQRRAADSGRQMESRFQGWPCLPISC